MRHFRLSLTLITLLALMPRVILIFTRGSFWFDEVFTLELAKLPFGEMFQMASQDTNPPLWTMLMWPWVHLFPHTEWIVRIPAVILGTATVPLAGLLGKRVASERVGLISATITALSPTLIYFSTEARMYALFVFLSVLAAYLIQKRAYAFVALLLLATHTYGLLPVIGFYVRGLIELPKTMHKKWHLTHAGLVAAWGAWIAWSYLPKLSDLFSNSWFMRVAPPVGWPLTPLFETVTLRGTVPSWIFFCASALALGVIVFGLIKIIREKNTRLFGALLPLFLGIAVAGFFGPARLKYFLFILPLAALIIAEALARMPKKIGAACGALIGMIVITSTIFFIRDFRFSWDRAGAFAKQDKNAIILIPWTVNSLPFAHYYGADSAERIKIIPQPGTEKTDMQALLAYNWKWEMKPEYISQKLGELAPPRGRLLIVQSDPYVYSVREWLIANGWMYQETKTFDIMESVKIEVWNR